MFTTGACTRLRHAGLWYLEVLQAAIEEQVFSACQGFPQQVMLGADPHHGIDVCHV